MSAFSPAFRTGILPALFSAGKVIPTGGGTPPIDSTIFFDYVLGAQADFLSAFDTSKFSTVDASPIVWTADNVPFIPENGQPSIPNGARVVGKTDAANKLVNFDFNGDELPLIGDIINLSTELTQFSLTGCPAITGSFPTLPSALVNLYMVNLGLSGNIPELSSSLEYLDISSCAISGFAVENLPISLNNIIFNNSELTQELLESILALLGVDIMARPSEIYVDLTGASNAIAGPTALAIRDALLLQQPLWVIDLNE